MSEPLVGHLLSPKATEGSGPLIPQLNDNSREANTVLRSLSLKVFALLSAEEPCKHRVAAVAPGYRRSDGMLEKFGVVEANWSGSTMSWTHPRRASG
jgi:hypothetical protein